MERIQKNRILADLHKKMVFLVGPRQVGKTYLSKEILREYAHPLYLSYDVERDRNLIKNMSWLRETDLIVFDEIHKMRGWKNYLKGVYDTKPDTLHVLVTGSARLDAYKHAGDSLAGRYRVHHLLPFGVKELAHAGFASTDAVELLMRRGGFPEPLFANSKEDADIWRRLYAESLLREDVLDFKDIDNFKAIQHVFAALRSRVGSPVSYASIAGVIGISPKTVKTYISILESLYIVFLIRPYTKKVARSILKEPKVYFYDTGLVQGDDGVVFENMVAVSLLKHVHAVSDETGQDMRLATLRNKSKKEVDFAIVTNDELETMIEVKLSDEGVSDGLLYFAEKNNFAGHQIVKNIRHPKIANDKISVLRAEDYLATLRV